MWGPHVPGGALDYGPYGRLDGERYRLRVPVRLRVGQLVGEVVQPEWALFSRRPRGVHITLGSGSWLYRVAGLVHRTRLERADGALVAKPAGAFGTSRMASSADAVDVAVVIATSYGVSSGELTVQG